MPINTKKLNIITKEQLKSHIHNIHNFIRNSGAGYSMTAMKTFVFFYGLKLIEPYIIKKKINMTLFSELVKLANTNSGDGDGNKILTKLCDSQNKTGIMYELTKLDNLKEIVFDYIPRDMKAKFYVEIVKMVDEIPIVDSHDKGIDNEIYDVDFSGKLYEYFIGRDHTAISELGAYFTDRHITSYIIDQLELDIEDDGSVPKFIDPFGGSGGFTLNYVDYFNKNYDLWDGYWKDNIQNIYHYDMNQDVIKICGLEIFALTHEVPNMLDHLKRTNSFKDEFSYNIKDKIKFKYVLSNPPYGGNSNKGSTIITDYKKIMSELKTRFFSDGSTKKTTSKKKAGSKTKKVAKGWTKSWAKKQYDAINKKLKQHMADLDGRQVNFNTCSTRIREFCEEYDTSLDAKDKQFKLIKTKNTTCLNDKEACSLILFMDLLDEGGTCVGVLKEGIFFDNKYASIRKCLIDKFNVYKIVSVPADQFENTTTKTSIIFFKNDGPTERIEFSELVVNKEDTDVYDIVKKDDIMQLELVKTKDKISSVTDRVVAVATRKEIAASTMVRGKKKYLYSLSYKKYVKGNEIKCGKGYELVKIKECCDLKNGYAFKSKEFVTNGIPIIKIKDIKNMIYTDNITDYINKNDSYKKFIIKKDDVLISLTGTKPSDVCNIGIYASKNNAYLNQRVGLFTDIKLDKAFFISLLNLFLKPNVVNIIGSGSIQSNISSNDILNFKIPMPKSQTKLREWVKRISEPYNKLQESRTKLKGLESNVQAEIKRICDEEECVEKKLGDVCETEQGIYIKKSDFVKGIYPVYGGGDVSKFTNKFNRENTLVINKDGISNNCVRFVWGKFFLNHHGWTLKHTDINQSIYVNYWLLNNQNKIIETSVASVQKGINKENFYKIKIKIPINKSIIKALNKKFIEIKKLQSTIKKTESKYQQVLLELKEDAISNSKSDTVTQKNSTKKISQKNKQIVEI